MPDHSINEKLRELEESLSDSFLVIIAHSSLSILGHHEAYLRDICSLMELQGEDVHYLFEKERIRKVVYILEKSAVSFRFSSLGNLLVLDIREQ